MALRLRMPSAVHRSTPLAAARIYGRFSRGGLQCCAEAQEQAPAVGPPQRTRSNSMIRSLAAAVELTGQIQRYETLAGRSAMVGVAAALFIELVTDHSIILAINPDTALTYAGVVAATLAAAVAVALARSRMDSLGVGGSLAVLEAVYASLTAVRRSAASVTQAQVDKAVDGLLEGVLDSRFDSFSIDGLLEPSTDEEEDV